MSSHQEPAFAVEIRDLSKTYAASGKTGEKHALKGVSLNIPKGSVFGLLGPNGAGKSTLINIMAGLVLKTSGSVSIWGHDIENEMRAARRSIGIVPQELNIDPFFTPLEALDVQAGLYGVPKGLRKSREILEAVGLAEQADVYARRLSGGMRRRLLVAKALVHQPPVLVLDEPTAGVDVELRRQLWDYVRDLNAKGTTVLLTTHYLEEAEELCDEIAIINNGSLIAHEPKRDLLRRLDGKVLTVTADAPLSEVPAALARFEPKLDEDGRLVFCFATSRLTAGEILAACTSDGIAIQDVSTSESDLEDIFLQLTGSRESDGHRATPGA
ncbi:MAG: ABC transporter ATP-binding protein [Magnetovibrionaceae bacterium]